ncbi:hypothetical protein [Nostocoides jenkinsii]|uniref:Uncharacterized protein n=1 Tax=Nostocoides jenkinsii Ben 74 TaxID=1193518 RepID=A0A077MEA3_9MICO|nr:hypothetical protein [Tetrasphaera jenkinsii]CCI53208.1 conserved hypothetical protein [Tetrasphaera jenkinsii Ben 74]
MSEQDWSAKAKENADFHAAALARAQERQAKVGGELLSAFVGKARAAGIPAHELTARPYRGNGRYRTGIQGWYLLPDRSLGVDEQGRFFILSCPPSLLARVRGVTLTPSPATLRVGERDGESMDLSDVLAKRLGAGAQHP